MSHQGSVPRVTLWYHLNIVSKLAYYLDFSYLCSVKHYNI